MEMPRSRSARGTSNPREDGAKANLEEIVGTVRGDHMVDGGLEIVADREECDGGDCEIIVRGEAGGQRADVQPAVLAHDAS